jgi:hypothetical protein
MKAKRNLIQFCLLVTLLALPDALQAQLFYTNNGNGTCTITHYIGTVGPLTIPSTINNLTVTIIGNSAFNTYQGNTSPTSVTFPNSVTNIGDYAFIGSTNLTNIIFGTNATSIGTESFLGCPQLSNIVIPDNIISIGAAAFQGCNALTNVTIGNGVTSVADDTFQVCLGLTSVTIGNSVTSIGNFAFSLCGNLTSIIIGNNVTNIEKAAFQGCGMTHITIPASVSSILDDAFLYCGNLKELYFKGNPPSLGFAVFDGVTNATVYYLPGTIGWGTMYGGFPTVLWNPQAQTSDGSFGVLTNQFGFNITGSSNLVIVIEACTNLISPVWTPIGVNTLNTFIGTNGTSYFSDPQWTNYPVRFYRLRSP